MQIFKNLKGIPLRFLFTVLLSLLAISTAGCAPSGDLKVSDSTGETAGADVSEDSAQTDPAAGKDPSERADAVNTGDPAWRAASRAGDSFERADAMNSAGAARSAAAGTGETSESAAVLDEGEYKAVIVIDPGHQAQGNPEQESIGPGSSETKMKVSGGTSGVATGVPEYQLTLDIGLSLKEELKKRGYKVILTRKSNDVDISNAERASIANALGADAFVRLHANGIGDQGHSGAMTICQTPWNSFNADRYSESRALADCILEAYARETGINYEYVWETDTMSGINWSQVPVTILEMGYMTNPEEDLRMQDPQMQEKMVEGIADGIDEYFRRIRENEDTEENRADENVGQGQADEGSEGNRADENAEEGWENGEEQSQGGENESEKSE